MSDIFNVETASFKELQEKGKELGVAKTVGIKTDELRALVAEALSKTDPDPVPQELTPVEPKVDIKTSAPTPKPKAKAEAVVEKPVQLSYNGRVVVNVTNKIISGVLYKDVHLANGEVHTISKKEFDTQVIEL